MLGVAFFIISILSGISVLRLLPFKLTWSENIFGGAVLGMVMSSWLTLILALLFGYNFGLTFSTIVLIAAAIVGFMNHKKNFEAEPHLEASLKFIIFWVSIIGLSTLFIILLNTHFLPVENGIWYSAGYTWSDLALHMSLASSFAHAQSFSFNFSIFNGTNISYPFIIDFFSGMMARLGASWRASFLLPNAVLLFAFLRLLFSLSYRLLKSLKAAWIHALIVIFSGSAWGFFLFLRDASVSGLRFAALSVDYTNLATLNLNFANLVTSHLFPQRSYLFGIAVFLLAMLMLLQWEKERRRLQAIIIGALIGLLPLIHIHTFFVAVGVVGILIIWILLEEKKLPRGFLEGLIALAICALPQVAFQFFTAYHSHFVYFHFGWMTPPGTSAWAFWLRNAGIAVPLVILSPLMVRKSESRMLRVFMIMGAFLFTACNLFIFQPNDWDNMKFLTYSYIFLMLPVALWLANLAVKWYGMLASGAILLLLTGSGIAAVYRDAEMQPYEFLSADDVAFGDYLQQNIPSNAVILTSDRFNSPVTTLGGYSIVMGYRGWLWSYGIDYTERQQDVTEMLGGAPQASDLFKKYNISYVAISADDHLNFYVNDDYFMVHELFINQIGEWTLYKIVD